MSTMNYRTVNLALPTGGNSPASTQHGKHQDAVPSSPSNSSSPSRQRNTPITLPRSAYLMKPLYTQNQSVVSNALVLTGHQPPTASTVSHAVVVYGQNANSSKPPSVSQGDHFRPRTATGQGSSSSAVAHSHGRQPSLPPSLKQSVSSLAAGPAISANTNATGNGAAAVPTTASNPTSQMPPQVNFADDELMILKEQILKLQRALESLGSATFSPGCGVNITGAGSAHVSSNSSSSVGSMSSSSLVFLGGITVSTTSSSGSSSSGSSSSSAGSSSNRTSRSGESIPAAPSWPVSSGGLEAMLQQACAPLTAAAAPSASPQSLFTSVHDAAMTAARSKLLDLFVRKAHQLLLESAPELWLPPTVFSNSGVGAGVVPPAAPEAPLAAAAATPLTRIKPSLAPGVTADSTGAAAHNARIQSAPVARGRSSSSSMPALLLPAASPEVISPVSPLVPQAVGAQQPSLDLSPAGVLVAASRRLSELQAIATGRGARSRAAEQQIADTQAKLDSALADNTLLRNMISELQANAARPCSRSAQRPESPSFQPPRPSTPSQAPPPDPALLRHISTLTSDLGLVRGRLDATQKCLEAAEMAAADLRKQLQESQSTSRKPATSSRACQTQSPMESEAESSESETSSELRARVAQLESEAADARKEQQALRERLSEAEAEARRLYAVADAADDVRQKLEVERRLVSELHSQLGRSSTEAAEAAARLSEARARLSDLDGQLRQRTAAAAVETGTIRELQAKLDAAASREGVMRRELDELGAARRRAEGDAESMRRRLTEAEAALGAARREAAAAVEKGDRKCAELAARISALDHDQKRLAEELRATKAELDAARQLAARKERDANAMRDEKYEACARLTSAHHELDAERRRLAEELAAAQKLRSQLLDDANAVKALGTLVQAKTLRLDFGGGATSAAVGMGVPSGGTAGVRPGTGDPAATVRLTNLVKEQQEKLQELEDKLSSREDRCARLQVALTQAETETAAAGKAVMERMAQLAETKAALEAAQDEVTRLKQQLDELSRHGDSVKAHNAELHKMAEKLQREGAAAAGEVRELCTQLDAANQQLSEVRTHRQRLLDEVVALSEQRDSAASDAATLKAQRRTECSRLEELQAALLLATQKLAGAERTITAQDERIALLLARARAAEERLASLGVSPPQSPGAGGGGAIFSAMLEAADARSGDAAAAAAAEALLQRAGSTVPLVNSGVGGSGAAAGGAAGGLQPPVGSLSLAPEAVAAHQRLNQLMTGGTQALGSMVQDMINKVLAESTAGGGGGGGGANGSSRASRASARSTAGGGSGSSKATSTSSGAQTASSSSASSSSSSSSQGLPQQPQPPPMLLRPSSASVVGRVLEHAPPGFGRQHGVYANSQSQSTLPQHGAGFGFAAGAGGGGGGALRPQSAWTHRGGGGGGIGMGGTVGTSSALMRRSTTSFNHNLSGSTGNSNGGLQTLSETDAFVGAAAAGTAAAGAVGSGGGGSSGVAVSLPSRSASPTKMLGMGLPGGAGGGRRVSSGGGINGGGGRSSGGRPTTAISKKTVLLLSMNSPAAQLDEVLAVDDDWQPV